jgi:hypothetical protein
MQLLAGPRYQAAWLIVVLMALIDELVDEDSQSVGRHDDLLGIVAELVSVIP